MGKSRGPAPALRTFVGLVVGLVLLGLVLGGLWRLLGGPLSTWWYQGKTLSGFVQAVLIEWPQQWGWLPPALVPRADYAPVLTAVLGWVVVIMGFMLPMVTYQIYALRKILGFMQARLGPTQAGPEGLLQTPADVVKLLSKEDVIPRNADRAIFTLAPFLVLVPASMTYLIVPFGNQSAGYSLQVADLNIGILFVASISSVAVIGIIIAGWSSNNKYSLLGAMRSAAQLITYEIPLSMAMITPCVWAGTLRLQGLVEQQHHLFSWLLFPSLLGGAVFVVSALAELGHIPFDLPEAESELISGYNTEYSGMKFAMFFLAEFSNAFVLSAIGVTLFLGGWQSPFPASWPLLGWDHGLFALFWFFLKVFGCIFVLFWLRATLPRFRIDQLMKLGWTILIPVALVNLFLVALLRLLLPG